MILATNGQKLKMEKVGVAFNDSTTKKEAREALADELLNGEEGTRNNKIGTNKSIGVFTLVENSDWND